MSFISYQICHSNAHLNATVSTAVRFTTLLDSTNSLDPSSSKSPPSQPPTTITAYFTPVTGHFSTAYAARVSRDLALCSRFSFNVYDYESDWTMGGEWWMRRRTPSSSPNEQPVVQDEATSTPARSDEIQGVVKARFSTSAVSGFLCFLRRKYISERQIVCRTFHFYGKVESATP